MKKRLSIFFVGTAVAVVAAVGAFAGIAAQDTDETGSSKSFAERVASILGLETETVEDAFTQAKDEMRDDWQESYLAKLVEDGTLTQDEADGIFDWIEDKPDVEYSVGSRFGRWGGHGFGKGFGSNVLSEEALNSLVEKEVLSQDDADSLQSWYDERPDAVAKLMPSKGDFGDWGKRGGRHGRMGRWGHHSGDGIDKDSDKSSQTDIDA